MQHVPIDALARLAALQLGSPVILVAIRMVDSECISRLPASLPAETCGALFRGPQVLAFDDVSSAVTAFNTLVDETLEGMNLDYVITLTNGFDDAAVHSNIEGLGDANGHPHCEMDGEDAWFVSYPSES